MDKLALILPNVVEKYLVEYKMFSHADFVLAKDVVQLVYNRVIEVMNNFWSVADIATYSAANFKNNYNNS